MNNNTIIKLKRRHMIFDDSTNRINARIDPSEAPRYVEPVRDERELDTIYNITSNTTDYVEPNGEGQLS